METNASTHLTSTPTSTVAMRSVEGVYASPGLHWVGDGFRVTGYFSAIPSAARKLSPFLLLDYHPPYEYSATTHRRGVGVHPHRGFETVTLAWQGAVAHRDSTGSGGIIGPGDVQWMTAASGILHNEYHEEKFGAQGGTFHMAQLWVNLPAAHKMDTPRYQPLSASAMGSATLPNGAGLVRVIAGEFQGTRGPAKTFTPIALLDAQLHAGGTFEFAPPRSHNVGVLVMSGSLVIRGSGAKPPIDVSGGDFVVFNHDGDAVVFDAQSDAQLLVMSGEPIDEPIVQYGPFVMNTNQEIMTAMTDYNNGKFGHLED